MTAERIQELNAAFRTTFVGGRALITRGALGRGEAFAAEDFAAVKAFTAFTPENDPHGEHDFGSLTVSGTKLYFKIDYYDLTEQAGSPDPADPEVTTRVLTILLPEEY